jgi:NDP-sugar pyrophosphorylase family protein
MSFKPDNVQIIVLAGGLATRLGALTQNTPKSMVKINGKPFLEYQLEMFKKSGFNRVLICLGHLGEQIEGYFGDGSRFGIDIKYSYEEKPLGTAGALKNAGALLGDRFFTIYGDSYITPDFDDIWNVFLSKNKQGLMTVYKNNNLYDASNTIISGDIVTKYDKCNKTPDMACIEYGLNLFHKDVLARIPKDCFYELGDVFISLIADNELSAYEVKERFYEIGSPSGLQDFISYIGANK